jgi:hypothetical protein
VVFRLSPTPNGWKEAVLYDDYLTLVDSEHLGRATTTMGGKNSCRVPRLEGALAAITLLLAIAPSAAQYTTKVINRFNITDGAYPYAGLIWDAAGNLYGVKCILPTPVNNSYFRVARHPGTIAQADLG